MAWWSRTAGRVVAGLCVAGAAGAAQAATTLQVEIDLRAEIAAGRFDPRQDRVGVRGSLAPLAWDRSRLADDADGDGRYELVLRFDSPTPAGQPLQYKFKRERVGFEADGWEVIRDRVAATLESIRRIRERM